MLYKFITRRLLHIFVMINILESNKRLKWDRVFGIESIITTFTVMFIP